MKRFKRYFYRGALFRCEPVKIKFAK